MPPDRNVVIRLKGWARTLVLRETGEPVELVHLEELGDRRRAFVELPSGLRTYVPEAALTNRVARLSEGTLTLAGVAIAGVVLGYSFSLPEAQLTVSSHPRPVIVGALEG